MSRDIYGVHRTSYGVGVIGETEDNINIRANFFSLSFHIRLDLESTQKRRAIAQEGS